MFNPSRLRLARQRLGLSLTKLANESGVSLRSLTNYENGKFPPTPENLQRLADVLALPPAFFERESIDPVSAMSASFRKLSRTTATKRDAVLADASLAVEFFGLLEARFKLPDPDIPPVENLSPEHAADFLRRAWNLSDRPIANLIHLLEAKGVRIVALRHEHSDIDAFCFSRDRVPYIFLNTSKSGERQRFDAAHELGHLVLHAEDNMEASESKVREMEANRFAASLLMPSSAVYAQSMASASLERVLAARSYWKVSAMAMTHRLHELHLLSDWQYRTMCISLSDDGYRSSEPGGIVRESSQLLKKVLFGGNGRVRIREAAAELDVNSDVIRVFLQGLVPVAA